MNRDVRIEMPYEAEWIIKKIRERGFEAFAVGGCVRDTLLGRIPGDWDITTSAKPEEVKEIFGKTVDTGLQHGTVTIIKNRKGYEVTTYRIDGEYRDGRHPDSVEFTSSLLEDLKRRDFTINAMAYSHETGIVDAFDGMGDLEKKVIRCVGCPRDRPQRTLCGSSGPSGSQPSWDFPSKGRRMEPSGRSHRTLKMSARSGSRWSLPSC